MRPSRWIAAAGAALAVATSVAAAAPEQPRPRPRPVLLGGPAWRERASDTAWLSSGSVPGAGTPWEDLARTALLDLRALTLSNGASLAAAARGWHYVWPRDAAFAAVAFARTGHGADAERVLAFLQRVQEDDGGFEARYVTDGSGPPDSRRRQSDGAGWALWALSSVASANGDREGMAARLRPLLYRATSFALRQTENGTRLPWPSPDFWELPESRVTLGTVAPLLAGLRAAVPLFEAAGDARSAARAAGAAASLAAVVDRRFGPGGYQRYGSSGGTDAAVAFLMPPFAPGNDEVVRAWRRYQNAAHRTAGGLAPGSKWHHDGVSWTPETAVVAYTAAASGHRVTAARWLDWLDSTRTPWGALPEKVLDDGSPAGPAPLAWTSAAVVLAIDALERPPGP
ncbi:MAG TPA: hypothetical protein VGX28_09565 [Frankiaceae bacterium]|nr:hypothetical protein [Frankiaceae bacterium]